MGKMSERTRGGNKGEEGSVLKKIRKEERMKDGRREGIKEGRKEGGKKGKMVFDFLNKDEGFLVGNQRYLSIRCN